jgi:hypothetical protein
MIDQPTRITRQLSRAAPNLENIFALYKTGEMVEMVERYFKPIVDCDKMLIACEKANHPLQRNTKFVNFNMTKIYTLNRTEYANLLGITPNAVRMRLRQGKLEGQYIFENGKYNFKPPEGVRGSIDIPLVNHTTPKKKYRRGNHFKGNYPNEAFRKHNEAKMLAKLKENVDEEVQELLPEAIEIAKQKKMDRINAALPPATSSLSSLNRAASSLLPGSSFKNYGTGIINESNKGYLDNINPLSHKNNPKKFTATNRGKKLTPEEWGKKYYG